jgi:iron(III) transport system permease protein
MEGSEGIATSRAFARLTAPSLSRFLEFHQFGSIVVLVILAILVVVPLIFMLLASVRPAGVLPFAPGVYTLAQYTQAFSAADSWPVIRNTLLYAGLGVFFALPISFGFAFLTERTDMPLRNAMYVLMFLPMSTPIFATALGWVLLLGPRGGTANVYFRWLAGSDAAEGPFNIYSIEGLIFVHVLGIIPTMWLFLTAVLRQMDPLLEEAALASGANRYQVLRSVTAPLMRPGVAAVVIYFFSHGIGVFGVAVGIGSHGRHRHAVDQDLLRSHSHL